MLFMVIASIRAAASSAFFAAASTRAAAASARFAASSARLAEVLADCAAAVHVSCGGGCVVAQPAPRATSNAPAAIPLVTLPKFNILLTPFLGIMLLFCHKFTCHSNSASAVLRSRKLAGQFSIHHQNHHRGCVHVRDHRQRVSSFLAYLPPQLRS